MSDLVSSSRGKQKLTMLWELHPKTQMRHNSRTAKSSILSALLQQLLNDGLQRFGVADEYVRDNACDHALHLRVNQTDFCLTLKAHVRMIDADDNSESFANFSRRKIRVGFGQ